MKYIGTKVVEATPMKAGSAHQLGYNTGSSIGTAEGYQVTYKDGYKSWSPKEVFDKAYRPTKGMTFGQALEAMKSGIKVARSGWNGKGMWLKLIAPGITIVGYEPNEYGVKSGDSIPCRPFFQLFTAQKDLAKWAPSGSDALAEDWMVVDKETSEPMGWIPLQQESSLFKELVSECKDSFSQLPIYPDCVRMTEETLAGLKKESNHIFRHDGQITLYLGKEREEVRMDIIMAPVSRLKRKFELEHYPSQPKG